MRDFSIADSTDIKFECSQCGQRIIVERSAAGLTADCPMCNHPVTVPSVQESIDMAGDLGADSEPRARIMQAESTGANAGDLEEARAEIGRQNALFKKAVDECERVKANATHVQAELKSYQSDRQQLKLEVANARQATLAAEARLNEYIEAYSAAQQENAEVRRQFESEINALKEQFAAQEQAVLERDEQLAQAVRKLAKSKSDLSASVIEATGLRSELQAHQQGLHNTGEMLNAAKAELQGTNARLETLTEEHRLVTQERDDWKQRAEGFKHDLAAIDTGRDLLETREQLRQLREEYQALQTKFTEHAEQAETNSKALKGIVARQNTTLGVYHSEVRRLRRARFGLRLVYSVFALGMLALAFFACKVFAPGHFGEILNSLKHFKAGLF